MWEVLKGVNKCKFLCYGRLLMVLRRQLGGNGKPDVPPATDDSVTVEEYYFNIIHKKVPVVPSGHILTGVSTGTIFTSDSSIDEIIKRILNKLKYQNDIGNAYFIIKGYKPSQKHRWAIQLNTRLDSKFIDHLRKNISGIDIYSNKENIIYIQ